MTLFKQIIIILTFFQTLILGVVMWQNFKTANEFIQTQLYTDAKHTANSLGLSIAPVADMNDLSTVQTMINSLFDSGYYEMIRLDDSEGKEMMKNYQPTIIADVPQWFVKMINLEAPIAKSEIMAGWVPFGVLHVQNNSGLAYRQLWLTFKDVGQSFVLISIVAFVILNFILRLLLKPLGLVQEQAEAILENDFIFQKKIPFTTELKNVVYAMNSMVGKVKEIFDKEADTVRKYHELLYHDTVTKLYNRRYFQVKLKEYLLSEEESQGTVVFMTLQNQEELKSELGYEKAEALLFDLADAMKHATHEKESYIVARMNEGDFAMLLPTHSTEKTDGLCNELSTALQKVMTSYTLDAKKYFFSFGITKYTGEASIKEIFSKADFALTNSKAKGAFGIVKYAEESNDNEVILGKEAWQQELMVAMEQKRFKFAMQKAVDGEGKTYCNELFLRLEDYNGHIHNAGYFMPMINELKMNAEVDHYVIDRIAQMLSMKLLPDEPLSINIGKEILLGVSDWSWLEKVLRTMKLVSKHTIYFEVPNRSNISVDLLARLSKMLRAQGFGLGLDNFMIDGNSLRDLQEINPSYIKMQQSYLLDLFSEGASELPKQSLGIITSSMDIRLIAIGVEKEEEFDKLRKLGIDYVQGSWIEQPHMIG